MKMAKSLSSDSKSGARPFSDTCEHSRSAKTVKHWNSFYLTIGCLLMWVLVGCDTAPTVNSSTPPMIGTVHLEIDFSGQGENISVQVPCSADSTVFQILQHAQLAGKFDFQSTGHGDAAFVSAIDGVKNEGGSGKNWVFRINGKLAQKGCDVLIVTPDDHVSWDFTEYDAEQD